MRGRRVIWLIASWIAFTLMACGAALFLVGIALRGTGIVTDGGGGAGLGTILLLIGVTLFMVVLLEGRPPSA